MELPITSLASRIESMSGHLAELTEKLLTLPTVSISDPSFESLLVELVALHRAVRIYCKEFESAGGQQALTGQTRLF